MRFHAPIGVFDFERERGNDFSVSVELRINADAFEDEQLHTSVSYADVYEVVRTHIYRETLLLETVAKHISDDIAEKWPAVYQIHTRIAKLTAPIVGFHGECEVEYFFEKICKNIWRNQK